MDVRLIGAGTSVTNVKTAFITQPVLLLVVIVQINSYVIKALELVSTAAGNTLNVRFVKSVKMDFTTPVVTYSVENVKLIQPVIK